MMTEPHEKSLLEDFAKRNKTAEEIENHQNWRNYFEAIRFCQSASFTSQHAEPHETFTWYDYPTKRNKRIAIRRVLFTFGVLFAVWGLVCLTL